MQDSKLRGYIAKAPERLKNTLNAVYFGKASASKAIKAKCADCVGFEDVINRVRECTIITCPLHRVRPFQKKERTGDKKKGAIPENLRKYFEAKKALKEK